MTELILIYFAIGIGSILVGYTIFQATNRIVDELQELRKAIKEANRKP